MKAKVIKLKFTSPFHLNPPRDSLEKTETVIQSDMLVSALAVCHIKLYGDFCTDFFSQKLRVSSLFPFHDKSLFFPVPLFDFWEGKADRERLKKLGKLKYLEASLWRKVIAGERLKEKQVYPSGMFGVDSEEKAEEISQFFSEEELQRLWVGRDPFHFSQVRLAEKGGLFFLYHVDPEIETQFKASLRLLADEGLGSDRTVGKGLFEIQEEKTDFQLPPVDSSASHILSLSFFIPSDKDFKDIRFDDSYYLLQHKRGWYNTHRVLSLKKKGIFGFAEGSVFKSDQMPTGKKVTLLKKDEMGKIFPNVPVFDVLRSGFLFGLPVKVPAAGSVREVENG
jgi:CRISPR-associated protein Csm4